MATTIKIDNAVFKTLQSLAEPFVDTPNSVLRRLLNIDKGENQSRGQIEQTVIKELKTKHQDSSLASSRPKRRRASNKNMLAAHEYESSILSILDEHEGSLPARDTIAAVGKKLAEKFTTKDREYLASGTPRWHARTQTVRSALIKSGLLKTNSPKGIWEISEEGRNRIRKS